MPYGATKATRSKGYKVTMNTNGTATVREGAEGQLKTGAVGAPRLCLLEEILAGEAGVEPTGRALDLAVLL